VNGKEAQSIITEIFTAPKAVTDRAKEALR